MTGQLTPSDIRTLVAKAFVLEAISDKPGCTTRYEDLPGKPLQDFIMAGINASDIFGEFAADYIKDPTISVFSYNVRALQRSNQHKSPKNINFGLLEIMFPTVAARLIDNNPNTVIDTIVDLIQKTSRHDVVEILKTRKIAWSTSTNGKKTNYPFVKYESCDSLWSFYGAVKDDFTPDVSHYQWSDDILAGLPTLRHFFTAFQKDGSLLKNTKVVFQSERKDRPHISIGILADMCAAAMFLWLSFNDQPV